MRIIPSTLEINDTMYTIPHITSVGPLRKYGDNYSFPINVVGTDKGRWIDSKTKRKGTAKRDNLLETMEYYYYATN